MPIPANSTADSIAKLEKRKKAEAGREYADGDDSFVDASVRADVEAADAEMAAAAQDDEY